MIGCELDLIMDRLPSLFWRPTRKRPFPSSFHFWQVQASWAQEGLVSSPHVFLFQTYGMGGVSTSAMFVGHSCQW